MSDRKIKQIFAHKITYLKQKTAGYDFAAALRSWWKIFLAAVVFLFILYYPIGGAIINRIDKNLEIDLTPPTAGQSQILATADFLIDKEINQNLFTPNLPFFFPSYFLDNMPAFQTGEIKAISVVMKALAQKNSLTDIEEKARLLDAAELLAYSPKIWLFSPENKLIPAPSANSQYKKARKIINRLNQALLPEFNALSKNSDDLAFILQNIYADLNSSEEALEKHIREHSSSTFDFKDDDLFYYTQGKLYAYCLFLKALGNDYKPTVVKHNFYKELTVAVNSLQRAVTLSPSVIRNGNENSSFAPNHLFVLNFYILRTQKNLNLILRQLHGDKNDN